MNSSVIMFCIDAALIAIVWPFAAWYALPQRLPQVDLEIVVILALYPAANLIALYALGLYRRDVILTVRRSIRRLPLVVGIGTLAASAVFLLLPFVLATNHHGWPRHLPDPLFVAASICFTGCGVTARLAFLRLRKSGLLKRRLLVIGAGKRAWDLVWMLQSEGRNLHYDVTFVHDPSFGPIDPRLEHENTLRVIQAPDGILQTARRLRAEQIVIAPDERRGMALDRLIDCKMAGYPVYQYMSFLETEIRRIDIKRLDLSWLLYSDGFSFNMFDRALKRALDVSVSLILLVGTSPFLLGGMLAVWLQDRGSPFYSQMRVTKGARHFKILKLRTMRLNAESAGAVWADAKDPRITRAGNFLRRTRIDEIPQLFNILRGDMSFVGPRPERPEFTAKLAAQLPLYNERHIVKAGLTGWAQINYPYGASLDDARSKLSYDLYYVKNASIAFDLLIILQTLRVVLWPSGVR
ncbi:MULTISPECIES: TIGR03013 family XrtA/PEP-CTERM system glycosyltransferase [Acidiphilium]|uniref:Sugar transferase, PEP-CTERM system associated/exopolysaccharide biosynthesis polyprenyl glycosylphosphotransferase n=1 Tax=Acidiphilium rubrum TaxID=526 RepID=A0A8G2CKW5_ACIRU|nr:MULTISPECIES: TIGR03013 family XrtA/PEP-CTERM system glycosyltransferase [Acidiphilium]MBW4036256.1 TIGR03013 family PEP-CTERM/XrtA system glycosyltransferase [Pseudomonadota bacterium]SIQ57110.1 sugar transferase, PEP-CTERM system associated/exopolysaccharide biosynthesis polyprenyl glycosylphosphotransferase [Acidiphilium rubrum]